MFTSEGINFFLIPVEENYVDSLEKARAFYNGV